MAVLHPTYQVKDDQLRRRGRSESKIRPPISVHHLTSLDPVQLQLVPCDLLSFCPTYRVIYVDDPPTIVSAAQMRCKADAVPSHVGIRTFLRA